MFVFLRSHVRVQSMPLPIRNVPITVPLCLSHLQIELHVHLDGAIRVQTILDVAK